MCNFDHLKFVFAKTHIPHWYVKRTPENEKDYVALFNAIRKFGRVEKWRGRPYRYWYPGDGYKYWAMTSEIHQSWIINRAKVPSIRQNDGLAEVQDPAAPAVKRGSGRGLGYVILLPAR